MSRKPKPLDARQLKIAQTYAGGEYADHKTYDDVEEAGDTLYKFAIHEAEDADDDAQYAQRLAAAIDELTQLRRLFF